jgi:hypothetical protein
MQTKIPVYSSEATSREQLHFVVREMSLGRAKRAIQSGTLLDVSPEADWRKGRVTHVQEPRGIDKFTAREILPSIASTVLNRGRAGQNVANYPIPYCYEGRLRQMVVSEVNA